MSKRRRVVAIVGPTGSGKARLAAAAARATGAPLLSCDSMKVYRGLDVGTAKPPPVLREGLEWHGLDLVWPWESFNASRFVALFEELLSAERPLLMCGGTMLYLKAATEGLGEAPPRDEELRARLRAEADEQGSAALHARLTEVDPETAARVHPNDLRRLVRGLEVFELTGQPQSSYHGQFGRTRDDLERVVFVVEREREDMDLRINLRVQKMVDAGWVAECERLLAEPRGISREARQALGYRQIFAWLEAGRPEALEELVAKVQTATRRFARRQLTWLRHLEGSVHRLRVGSHEQPLDQNQGVVDRVVKALA